MTKQKSGKKYLFGLGDLIDRLSIVNIKISILESMVKDKNKSDADAGKAARLIRKINTERVAIRNIINTHFGHGYEDLKVEYFELLEKTTKGKK